jgi:hypothetical protein
MIYLIADKQRMYCKIGKANAPVQRLDEIQVGCPLDLEIVCIVQGSFSEEKELHEQFKQFYIRGEWFRYDTTIETYMKSLIQMDSIPRRRRGIKMHSSYSINPYIGDNSKHDMTNIRYRKVDSQLIDHIISASNNEAGVCTIRTEDIGCGKSTVYKAIENLLKANVIKRKTGNDMCYWVNPSVLSH